MARYPLARFWYPELMLFGTPVEATRALWAATRPMFLKLLFVYLVWLSPWAFLLGLRKDLLVQLIIGSGLYRLGRIAGPAVISGIFLPLWVACFFVAVHFLYRRKLHESLRRQLIDRGIRVCLDCGYDLREFAEPRCPECGTPFEEEQR